MSDDPPISRENIDQALAELRDWHSVDEFGRREKAIRSAIGPVPNHRQRRFKPWREAWVIARFAEHSSANSVRLLPPTEGGPDGQLEYERGIVDVEVTEAMEAGRKPGLERPGTTHDPVEQWVKRADDIPKQTEKAIQAKLAKPYAKDTTVLVYLNIDEWGIRESDTIDFINRMLATYRPQFGDLKIFWKDRWY